MNFKSFKALLQQRMDYILAKSEVLYLTDVDRDTLWDCYLNSFPNEESEQEHNCNCCRQYIKNYGNLVGIVDGKLQSIWEINADNSEFELVVKNMSTLVTGSNIRDRFFATEARLGTDTSKQRIEGSEPIIWNHLYYKLPDNMVVHGRESVASLMGTARSTAQVFGRALAEITLDALDTVLELIAQNSLYRGSDYKLVLEAFKKVKLEYDKKATYEQARNIFVWDSLKSNSFITNIRSQAIGTLLVDLSEGRDLESAVSAFERIMAPTNYKRPKALITQKQIDEAQKQIIEMGMEDSLGRRFANLTDITVNNTLFVHRSTENKTSNLSVFDALKKDSSVKTSKLQNFDKVEAISAKQFVDDILPKVNEVEVMFENKHSSNLVSLIAPINADAPTLFKWDSAFSWCYKDALTDSIKERVKAAGGEVNGFLRISLSWNNYDDLDLHIIEPNDGVIYYGNKHSFTTGARLDVDMNAGGRNTREPVENIIYVDRKRLLRGDYKVKVNNFSKRENIDNSFTVQIEIDGVVHEFSSTNPKNHSTIDIATINYDGENIIITDSIGGSKKTSNKEVWNISTNQFHRVNVITKSPNYWDGNAVGNEHLFFILDGCVNDDPDPRGFFNEFLKQDLMLHKRVFEVLGSRLKVEPTNDQLSGLGFSTTQRNELIVRVKGSFQRLLKVQF